MAKISAKKAPEQAEKSLLNAPNPRSNPPKSQSNVRTCLQHVGLAGPVGRRDKNFFIPRYI